MKPSRADDKRLRPPRQYKAREFVGDYELKPGDEVEFKGAGRLLCQLYGYQLMQKILAARAKRESGAQGDGSAA